MPKAVDGLWDRPLGVAEDDQTWTDECIEEHLKYLREGWRTLQEWRTYRKNFGFIIGMGERQLVQEGYILKVTGPYTGLKYVFELDNGWIERARVVDAVHLLGRGTWGYLPPG